MIASMRHPGPGTRCPVIHPGTGGVADGVSAVDAVLDALLSPVSSRCTSNIPSPARQLPGRRAGGPFAVFPGFVTKGDYTEDLTRRRNRPGDHFRSRVRWRTP